jgi:hypothetical protein
MYYSFFRGGCVCCVSLLVTVSLQAQAYKPWQVEKFKHSHVCEGCDFNELNLSPQILGNDDVSGASLKGTYFYGASIEHLNFQHVQAQELIGLGLMLHDNDLSHADFSYADLPNLKVTLWNRGHGVRFIGAGIDEANFSYTIFDAPQFQGASMSRAVLYHIEWPNADLSNARLRGANLTYAMLQGANLESANLSDALLNHADFTNANLLNADVLMEQLEKAASICNAILPDGSIGPC